MGLQDHYLLASRTPAASFIYEMKGHKEPERETASINTARDIVFTLVTFSLQSCLVLERVLDLAYPPTPVFRLKSPPTTISGHGWQRRSF